MIAVNQLLLYRQNIRVAVMYTLLQPTIHIPFSSHQLPPWPREYHGHGKAMVVCVLQVLQRTTDTAQIRTDLVSTLATLSRG